MEVGKRVEIYGPNEIRAAQRISGWNILVEQFKNVLILILLGATVWGMDLSPSLSL
jgi:Ca2+-transporting ATPase